MADEASDAGGVQTELVRSLSDGTFLAALCHDLRGQLGVLGNWLHVLDSASADSDSRRQAMAGLKGALTAETRLIEQVSDLSSILRGALPLSLEEIDLARLLKDLGPDPVLPATVRSITTDARRVRQALGLVALEGKTGTILVEELGKGRITIRGQARKGGPGLVNARLASALASLLGGLLTITSEGADSAFALELPTDGGRWAPESRTVR